MIRYILTRKWFIVCIVFVVVYAGLGYLNNLNTIGKYGQQTSGNNKLLQQQEETIEQVNTTTAIESTLIQAPAESNRDYSVRPINKENRNANATINNKSKEDHIEAIAAESLEPVLVSPHGFGPYPKIPKGAPVNPFTGKERRNKELLKRVVIKKWSEGERFIGATFDGERVYLNYPNTVYIRYGDTVENEDGTFTRPITSAGGSKSSFISERQMRSGQIPPGLHVLEFDKDGIDPYEYLNLP